jgi:hypothetical protein
MAWNTREIEPGTVWIEDKGRMVGSICNKVDRWHVEILWMDDDITGRFATYGEALAFVQGVEAMADRWVKALSEPLQS